MKTKIYIADISSLLDENVFSEKYNEVSAYRRNKIDKMKFQRDKSLSLGAGLLLKKALSDCGIDEQDAQISVYENGKPHIDGIEFNLSHSNNKVMCAVSDFPVGCDVELIKEIDFRIAERFFASKEIEQIDGSIDTFFRLWTLKESFMKVTGLGMSLPLNQFSINLGEEITVSQELNSYEYKFYEYNFDDGYKYACCIENSTDKPEIITVNF